MITLWLDQSTPGPSADGERRSAMSWSRRLLVLAVAGGLAGSTTAVALADGSGGPGPGPGRGIPEQVFAPYFETYAPGSAGDAVEAARESGAKDLIFAFLETNAPGSCTVYWNGDTGTPVEWSDFGPQIQQIRDEGGNVWPSFGGYTASVTDTNLADSCTSVTAIAREYERVITTYGFTRLDFDIESDYCAEFANPPIDTICAIEGSLANTAAINRRNQALSLVQQWAAAHRWPLQIEYTIPVAQSGPLAAEDFELQNAVANGVRLDIVNALTFDYYSGTAEEMATDTMTAAEGTLAELEALYPDAPAPQLWHMVGVTDMIGIDDYGPYETFTLQDAYKVEAWAAQQHLGLLSFWALQRDNQTGNPTIYPGDADVCPFTGTASATGTWPAGDAASGDCSSLVQYRWEFSHIFEPFTREFPFRFFGGPPSRHH
jgi:hypothetical protein